MSVTGRRHFLAACGQGLLGVGAAFVLTHSAAAAQRWPAERRAGLFFCCADFPLDDYDSLWEELARLQDDLIAKLRIEPAREPVFLFLFNKKATYQDYLRQHFPSAPGRKALFIKQSAGPGMVFAYLSTDFETDVRHESTHALLHASLPVVPLWLDEGLAEYFEVPPDRREQDSPHFGKVKWAASFGQTPGLESLEQLGDLEAMGASEYRHAWSWVHFMLHGPAAAHDELVSFLTAISQHAPPEALSHRLRQRIPELEQSFCKHFRNWKA